MFQPDSKQRQQLERIGWILFVLSALLYIAASIESGSLLSLAGSLVFLIACAFFLMALRN